MGNEPGKDFEGKTVVIDSDGDIYLEVSKDGAGSTRFLVVSQVLWTASPVFRCMFGPRSKFMEGAIVREAQVNGTQPPSISCEDDPEAFGLVLNILHHRCESVPEIISVDMFIKVATITDKYGMRCALSLWALVWLGKLRDRGLLDSPHAGWLFVACIFQWQDVFSSVAQRIILYAEVDEAGNLLVPARSLESEFLVLHMVPEVIPKHVEELLINERSRRLRPLQAYISHLLVRAEPSSRGQTRCMYSAIPECNTNRVCDTVQLGNILTTSYCLKWQDDASWKQSIRKLVKAISSIEEFKLGRLNVDCYCSKHSSKFFVHSECSYWLSRLQKLGTESMKEDFKLSLSEFRDEKC